MKNILQTFSFSFADSSGDVVSYTRKKVHKVQINHLAQPGTK